MTKQQQLEWLKKYIKIETIKEMDDLKALYLDNNQITSVPELNLPNLKFLSLDNNQITSIPKLNLPNLEILSLHDNPNLKPEDIKLKSKYIAYYNRFLILYELFEKLWKKQITGGDILKIKNAEHRMTALSVYGADNLLREFNAEKINTNSRGDELYLISKEVFGIEEDVKIGKYLDWSTERVYIDFMRPECETIDEALAKRHHFTLERWLKVEHA